MDAVLNEDISARIVAKRRLAEPEITVVSESLSRFRVEYLKIVNALKPFRGNEFTPLSKDPRAPKLHKFFEAYYDLLVRLSRPPTISELTANFNSNNLRNYNQKTVTKYMADLNLSAPESMPELKLTPNFISRLYAPAFVACYKTLIDLGRFPSNEELQAALGKWLKGAEPTPQLIRSVSEGLESVGIKVKIRHGDLTKELVSEAFLAAKLLHQGTPTLGQTAAHLEKHYRIRAANGAISKVLEAIRTSLPPESRQSFMPKRPGTTTNREIINGYKAAELKLEARGLKRFPTVSEIFEQIKKLNPETELSIRTVRETLQKINAVAKDKGQAGFLYRRISSPLQDSIEAECSILTKKHQRDILTEEIVTALEKHNLPATRRSVSHSVKKANIGRNKARKIPVI